MIIIASDHAGFELKREIIKHLEEIKTEFTEMGCINGERCDYPTVAEQACREVTDGRADKVILVCGTGIGISMAANKVKGIRAALCTDEYMSEYARRHNDANALCLGGRVIGAGLACNIVDRFLSTGFEGGRHADRVNMITRLEN